MHERQWRGEHGSSERSRDEEIDRRALEIMERLRCNWIEAWASALAEQRLIDGQGDVDLEKRAPAQHRIRHPGRMTLSEQIGRAMPPRPGTVAPARTTRSAALPAAVMRSAEHAEIDPEAAELVTRARRGGAPLDAVLQRQLEAALGTRLDGVRVHTDAEADAAARAIGARAFAVGDDVFFRDGAYDPQQRDGQRLIAHEVAHTVQARGASAPTDGATTVSQPGDAPERQADAFANAFVHGISVHGDEPTPSVEQISRPAQIQRETASGKEMWETREDPDVEAQRQEAFNIIRENRSYIDSEAKSFKIASEAIAGAILWEALENPYKLSLRPKSTRLGPGKVHTGSGSEAEKVEKEGRIKTEAKGGPVPALPKDVSERQTYLQNAKVAITYIAAIMRRHADNYQNIADVDISRNVGVLRTLYQGGNSEARAQKLADRRKADPTAEPHVGDEMGPWVMKNIETIRGWTKPPPRPH